MQADQKQITRLIKTAQGQLNGVLKMIEEDQYCVDISTQLMASEAILRKANKEILRAHMKGCVKAAMETGDGDAKIDELIRLVDKLSR